MTNKKDTHLNEDQLLRAVVDETDLPPSLQEHLKTCRLCRTEKARFEQGLEELGHMAERLAPSPSRKVRFPVRESSQRPRSWSWGWRTTLAAGMAAAAMVMVIVYGSGLVQRTREATVAVLTQEMWEDDQLMTEISELSENALPLVCFDISGESEPDFNEEFMDFVVPSTEGDLVSHFTGGGLC